MVTVVTVIPGLSQAATPVSPPARGQPCHRPGYWSRPRARARGVPDGPPAAQTVAAATASARARAAFHSTATHFPGSYSRFFQNKREAMGKQISWVIKGLCYFVFQN